MTSPDWNSSGNSVSIAAIWLNCDLCLIHRKGYSTFNPTSDVHSILDSVLMIVAEYIYNPPTYSLTVCKEDFVSTLLIVLLVLLLLGGGGWGYSRWRR